ncbi:MAG: hypothetical protein HQL75_10265 [Magnetococcales bacterium]|nr:hypothetical protein [Magnetococcales bacterium]
MLPPFMVDEKAIRHLLVKQRMWEGKVGQSRLPESWVSLRDYYDSTPSQKRAFQPESPAAGPSRATPSPEWVDASDYFLRGVRVPKKIADDENFLVILKEEAAKPPLPREAGITMFDALKQIHSVYGPHNAIFSRLAKLEQQDRKELDSGRIDIEEFERRAVASAIIRENHGRRMEKLTQWYLDNYFRIFENPEPVTIPDGTCH